MNLEKYLLTTDKIQRFYHVFTPTPGSIGQKSMSQIEFLVLALIPPAIRRRREKLLNNEKHSGVLLISISTNALSFISLGNKVQSSLPLIRTWFELISKSH